MNTKQIKDDRQYRVTLLEKIELYGRTYYPGRPLVVRGDVLKQITEKVANAEQV